MVKGIRQQDYPRVLVVTHNSFNAFSGGGITLTNLFRGWPPESIAQIHNDTVSPDDSVCRRFYKLERDTFHWMVPFSFMNHLRTRQAGELGSSSRPTVSRANLSLSSRLKSFVLNRLGIVGMRADVHISDGLKAWIVSFQPQLVYCGPSSLADIRLVRQVACLAKAPVALHIMDDWPTIIHYQAVFGSYLRRVTLREFEQLLAGAVLHMAICESMRQAYEVRYGYDFLAFHNTLDVQFWLPKAKTSWQVSGTFRIVYSGQRGKLFSSRERIPDNGFAQFAQNIL